MEKSRSTQHLQAHLGRLMPAKKVFYAIVLKVKGPQDFIITQVSLHLIFKLLSLMFFGSKSKQSVNMFDQLETIICQKSSLASLGLLIYNYCQWANG